MFNSLVESGSHRADLRRRGKFFLGATAFYAVLLAATGVGSIYAYNAHIEDASELEVLTVMRFSPAEARPEPARREESRPAANDREQQFATRTVISINTPYHSDRVAPEDAKDVSARKPVEIASFNSDPKVIGGPAKPNYGDGRGDGNRRVGPSVEENGTTVPPPPARVTPAPAPAPPRESKPVRLSSEILVGKAISKPAPQYPTIAKAAGVQGPVVVQVLIDENGRVVSAKVTSGHPLLQQAALQTAYRWKFSPTVLTGTPVKVTGVVTYNFVLNK